MQIRKIDYFIKIAKYDTIDHIFVLIWYNSLKQISNLNLIQLFRLNLIYKCEWAVQYSIICYTFVYFTKEIIIAELQKNRAVKKIVCHDDRFFRLVLFLRFVSNCRFRDDVQLLCFSYSWENGPCKIGDWLISPLNL